MEILLYVVILAGIGCIVYSAFIYFRKMNTRPNDTHVFKITENDGHFTVQYLTAVFHGSCTFSVIGEELERQFAVTSIELKLISPLKSLDRWTKDELYATERELNIRYPEAIIHWKEPMNRLLPNFREDSSPK